LLQAAYCNATTSTCADFWWTRYFSYGSRFLCDFRLPFVKLYCCCVLSGTRYLF